MRLDNFRLVFLSILLTYFIVVAFLVSGEPQKATIIAASVWTFITLVITSGATRAVKSEFKKKEAELGDLNLLFRIATIPKSRQKCVDAYLKERAEECQDWSVMLEILRKEGVDALFSEHPSLKSKIPLEITVEEYVLRRLQDQLTVFTSWWVIAHKFPEYVRVRGEHADPKGYISLSSEETSTPE